MGLGARFVLWKNGLFALWQSLFLLCTSEAQLAESVLHALFGTTVFVKSVETSSTAKARTCGEKDAAANVAVGGAANSGWFSKHAKAVEFALWMNESSKRQPTSWARTVGRSSSGSCIPLAHVQGKMETPRASASSALP